MADDYPDTWTTTGALPLGGTISGNLETVDDTDWFRLDVEVGHGYLFTPVMKNGKIPTITVYQMGNPISVYTTATDSFSSNDLANPFVPWQKGTYYLEVSGAQAGAYTVGMREAPDDFPNGAAAARPLTTAAPVAGRFDYAFDMDQFRIAAVAGTTYTVTLRTDGGNLGTASFLRLAMDTSPSSYVQDGATVSYTFTAYRSGDYVVSADIASHSNPAPGGLAYHMSLSAADLSAPALLAGTGTVDGAIVLRFDEAVVLGVTGSIELRRDSYGAAEDTWSAGDARIHVDGKTLTLDAGHAGALMPGKYWLSINGSVLKDALGNSSTSVMYERLVEIGGTAGGGLALAGRAAAMQLGGSAGSADAAVYGGRIEDYKIVREGEGFRVSEAGGYGTDTLSGIERVMFTQSSDVVALSLDGHLGQAFRLYTAAFGRVPDGEGLGFWLHAADSGVSLPAMARGFIDSKEFRDLYGTHPDDGAFVASLYRNVLHREGEPEGLTFWTDALDKGVDRADVLAGVSESTENQKLTLELIGNGIPYTPYG